MKGHEAVSNSTLCSEHGIPPYKVMYTVGRRKNYSMNDSEVKKGNKTNFQADVQW